MVDCLTVSVSKSVGSVYHLISPAAASMQTFKT